jgi:hypothetical protein
MRLPRIVVLAAASLFVVSAAGTLVGLGVFFWHDTDFWDYFDVGRVIEAATLLLLGLSVSSGVLFLHQRKQESYLTAEAILFLILFGISVANLLWLLPATLLV